jgi:hypothetical protein
MDGAMLETKAVDKGGSGNKLLVRAIKLMRFSSRSQWENGLQ